MVAEMKIFTLAERENRGFQHYLIRLRIFPVGENFLYVDYVVMSFLKHFKAFECKFGGARNEILCLYFGFTCNLFFFHMIGTI